MVYKTSTQACMQCAHRRACTSTISHTNTQLEKRCQIKPGKIITRTCNVLKVHKMKQNERERSHGIKMKKHAEVHCSTVASLLADNERERERQRERERDGGRERGTETERDGDRDR